jgi:nucleotide-binding universal stress UspA family protein
MKRILVGFDGSEGSKRALNRAEVLIDEDGEIFLLSVIMKSHNNLFLYELSYKKLKEKAKKLANKAIKDLGERSYQIFGIVSIGDPAVKIIDYANKLKVDLIVLGSRGESEISKYLLGGVANKVVQYAAKPVMVVR